MADTNRLHAISRMMYHARIVFLYGSQALTNGELTNDLRATLAITTAVMANHSTTLTSGPIPRPPSSAQIETRGPMARGTKRKKEPTSGSCRYDFLF